MRIETINAERDNNYRYVELVKVTLSGELKLDHVTFKNLVINVAYWSDREWADVRIRYGCNTKTYYITTTKYWDSLNEAKVLACATVCRRNNYRFDEQLWLECAKRIVPRGATINAHTLNRLFSLSKLYAV